SPMRGWMPRYSDITSKLSDSSGKSANRPSTSLSVSPACASAFRLACVASSVVVYPGASPMPNVAAPTMAAFPRGNASLISAPSLLKIARNTKLGIAKALFAGNQLLVIVADGVLLRHSDASMQLDALCANELASVAGHDLRRGHRPLALIWSSLEQCYATVEDGARLLHFDKHLRHAMLQRLELADGLAELHALFDIAVGDV